MNNMPMINGRYQCLTVLVNECKKPDMVYYLMVIEDKDGRQMVLRTTEIIETESVRWLQHLEAVKY